MLKRLHLDNQGMRQGLGALFEGAMSWIVLIFIAGMAGAITGMPTDDSPAGDQAVAHAAVVSLILYCAFWLFYRTFIRPRLAR